MEDKTRQQLIFDHIQKDAFANYLGAEIEIIKPGQSRISLIIKDYMTNFHGSTHGGNGIRLRFKPIRLRNYTAGAVVGYVAKI